MNTSVKFYHYTDQKHHVYFTNRDESVIRNILTLCEADRLEHVATEVTFAEPRRIFADYVFQREKFTPSAADAVREALEVWMAQGNPSPCPLPLFIADGGLTVAQVAEYRKCSTSTVYRALKDGALTGHKDRVWKVDPESLLLWKPQQR